MVLIYLGANWVHGLDPKVNPMYKYAQHLNLSLHPTSPDDYPGDDVLLFDVDCSNTASSTTTPPPPSSSDAAYAAVSDTAISTVSTHASAIVERNLLVYWTVGILHWVNNRVCGVWNSLIRLSGFNCSLCNGIRSYLPSLSMQTAVNNTPTTKSLCNKSSNKCKYTLVTKERYYEVLRRYEWITDHIDIHLHPAQDVCLSEAFKTATLASEDPSLDFGPLTAADRRCLNWCFDRVAIDSGLPTHKVSTCLHVYMCIR